MEQKIEVLKRSDSDVEDEIQRLLEESEVVKEVDGEESDGFKRLSKCVSLFLHSKSKWPSIRRGTKLVLDRALDNLRIQQ